MRIDIEMSRDGVLTVNATDDGSPKQAQVYFDNILRYSADVMDDDLAVLHRFFSLDEEESDRVVEINDPSIYDEEE